MRLKSKHDAPTRKRGSGCLQRGRCFRGMVPVVIDQCEVPACRRAYLAMPCEASANACEFGERSDDGGVLDAELGSDGNRGQRVRDVMYDRASSG